MEILYKTIITESLSAAQQKLQKAKETEGLHSNLPGKNGWFATAESCINFLTKDNEGLKLKKKYFDDYGISDSDMSEAIEMMYKNATTISGERVLTWNTCPFVFGPKDMCIRQAYADFMDDYKKFLSKVKTVSKPYNPSSLKRYHNGFGGGKSSNGLAYEIIIITQIIQFIAMAIQIDPTGTKHISENEFEEAFNHDDNKMWDILQRMYNMYEGHAFDSIIERYAKDPTLDLTKYVIQTGAGKTDRNGRQQLFNKNTFELTTTNIEKDMIESGKIIADVTILGENPDEDIYISVKLNAAQLSGATFENGFNTMVVTNINSGTAWENVKDDTNMIGFINLFKTFGIDPEDMYNQYVNKSFHDTKPVNDYDSKALGIFAQKLLGGNYWYTKPKAILFVPPVLNTPLEFILNKCHPSDSGKTLTFNGQVNGLKMNFVFRTDGNGDFPHRMFIQVSVPDLIDMVTK